METHEHRPFREGLFELNRDGTGFLQANRCRRCGLTFFPRRNFCTECGGTDSLEDVRLSRTGTLHTFTEVHRASPGLQTPYILGYVDLEDGVRILAPLAGCRVEDLRVGMAMSLVFGPALWKAEGEESPYLTYWFQPGRRSEARREA